MSDGAHLGISAGDAASVVIGGVDPDEVARLDTGAMAARIMATELGDIDYASDGYTRCADWVARQILELAAADPTSMATDPYRALRSTMPEGSPEREMLTSITGFQWGWSLNAARAILELPPVPNPAIVVIDTAP